MNGKRRFVKNILLAETDFDFAGGDNGWCLFGHFVRRRMREEKEISKHFLSVEKITGSSVIENLRDRFFNRDAQEKQDSSY